MKKSLKILLFIAIAVILWIALVSIDAGPIGIGIILSVFAFIDIITGKFKENEKIVWTVVVLIAIIAGMVGIVVRKPSDYSSSMEFLFALITIILSLSYFLVGRKGKEKKRISEYNIVEESEEDESLKHENENTGTLHYCPYCGNPVKDTFSFCSKCGKKIK